MFVYVCILFEEDTLSWFRSNLESWIAVWLMYSVCVTFLFQLLWLNASWDRMQNKRVLLLKSIKALCLKWYATSVIDFGHVCVRLKRYLLFHLYRGWNMILVISVFLCAVLIFRWTLFLGNKNTEWEDRNPYHRARENKSW